MEVIHSRSRTFGVAAKQILKCVLLNTMLSIRMIDLGIVWMLAPGSLGWDIGATPGVFSHGSVAQNGGPQLSRQEHGAGDADQIVRRRFLAHVPPRLGT